MFYELVCEIIATRRILYKSKEKNILMIMEARRALQLHKQELKKKREKKKLTQHTYEYLNNQHNMRYSNNETQETKIKRYIYTQLYIYSE